MMNKLAIIFVAVFVAAVTAAPNNLLSKSLEQVKRTAALLKPLHTQEKRIGEAEIQLALMMLDADHDGMLNGDELKVLLAMGGIPVKEIDTYLQMMMMFDKDKNGKLDPTELEQAAKMSGF